MTLRRAFFYVMALCLPLSSCTSPRQDESQVREIPVQFEQAWNRHDMVSMAKVLTEDVDWVTEDGLHWKGKAQVEAEHAKRHASAGFRESVWSTRDVHVAFVRPDVALVHVDWGIRGDQDPDGAPRKPRTGIMTWVVVKSSGAWRIRAAHATDVREEAAASVTPEVIQVTGTVHYQDLEGGFWSIRGDDGATYDPHGGLPPEFQSEGLRVRADVKPRVDLVSPHMAGRIVDIVSIEKI